MLGTNELKEVFQNTPEKIGSMLEEYFVKIILNRKSLIRDKFPQLLIISPPIIDETTAWASKHYFGATEKSKKLGKIYSRIAKNNNCYFLNGSDLSVGDDGVHLTIESHKKLAERILKEINFIDF